MKMNGIKLSPHCTRVVQESGSGYPDIPLHASLSSGRINIEFLNFDATGNEGSPYLSCCVEQAHTAEMVELDAQITHGVHTLSVYPHKSCMSALGYIVGLMSHRCLLFYDLVTSGSMLTFVVDRQDRPQICDYLARHIELPKSHTPFEQLFNQEDLALLEKCRQETCATWVEEKIKTYGLHTESNLDLYSLNTGYEDLALVASIMKTCETNQTRFYYSSAHVRQDGRVSWHFLADGNDHRMKAHLVSGLPRNRSIDLRVSEAMALISFQGPHFGDRYGIADRATSILQEEGIPLPLSGFTGSSIYMVVPVGHAQQARNALLTVFTQP